MCDVCQSTGMEYATANSDGDDFFKSCDECELGEALRVAANGGKPMGPGEYDPLIKKESECGSFKCNLEMFKAEAAAAKSSAK